MSFMLHFQLYLIKSFKACSIVSFYNLHNKYLDFKYHVPKRQLAGYFKTANSLFLSHIKYKVKHIVSKTSNKMVNKEKQFHFES